MIYQEYDINHARGIRLFESVRLDGLILEKGHILDDEDIIQLKLSGIKKIFGAEMSENDLEGSTALGVLSAKLCGSNTAYAVTPEGISQIIAQTDGVLMVFGGIRAFAGTGETHNNRHLRIFARSG